MTTNSSKSSGMRRQPCQARSQERVSQILDVAEKLFISEGYRATSTKAIAAHSQISIGSLYQFFPDKSAILYKLADRYNQQLHNSLMELDTPDGRNLSLSEYMEQVIDTVDRFFTDYPGYYAIFMSLQDSRSEVEVPELEVIDAAADAQLIKDLVILLSQYSPQLEPEAYEAIAFVLVKVIGNLLWISLSQEKPFRERLLKETKRLILSYLASYFPS